jgi:hypothetical protein
MFSWFIKEMSRFLSLRDYSFNLQVTEIKRYIRVDIGTLTTMGIIIPQGQSVTRMFNIPGGGIEVMFPHAIPNEALKVLR